MAESSSDSKDGPLQKYKKSSLQKLTEICLANGLPFPNFKTIKESTQRDGSVFYTVRCTVEKVYKEYTKSSLEGAKDGASRKMIELLISMKDIKLKLDTTDFKVEYEKKENESSKIREILQAWAPQNAYNLCISVMKVHLVLNDPETSIHKILNELKNSHPNLHYNISSIPSNELTTIIDKLNNNEKFIKITFRHFPMSGKHGQYVFTFCRAVIKLQFSFFTYGPSKDENERKGGVLMLKYLMKYSDPNMNKNSSLIGDSDEE